MNDDAERLALRSVCFAGKPRAYRGLKSSNANLLKSFLDTHQEALICAP